MNTNKYKEAEALQAIATEEARGGKASLARAEEMRRIYERRHIDSCGWFGRIMELASHTNRSRQVRVARQGKQDTFVKIATTNGKYRRMPAECKTNGGRIGSLLQENAPRFVVYSLNLCNAGTGYTPRNLAPVVLLREDFLRVLEECNAVKDTNGNHPEPAIQASSKKMFLRLSEAVKFDPERVYTVEEISLGK